MKKIILASAVLATLFIAGCSNENFKSANKFTQSSEDVTLKDEAKRNIKEKKEGDNISSYGLTMASTGVYSVCIMGKKNYLTYASGDVSISQALDLNEEAISCSEEGKMENVLNGISNGVHTYCSQENIYYYVTEYQTLQFYPMRDLRFKLVPCERK